MITRLLVGAACAALLGTAVPVSAATTPELPGVAISPSASQAVDSFYASRHGAPLWLRGGADSAAARELIGVLDRAPLDGLDSGPALAAQAEAMIANAQAGNPAASRLAGKCVARETLSVLKRTASPAVFRKLAWDNAHKIYALKA